MVHFQIKFIDEFRLTVARFDHSIATMCNRVIRIYGIKNLQMRWLSYWKGFSKKIFKKFRDQENKHLHYLEIFIESSHLVFVFFKIMDHSNV